MIRPSKIKRSVPWIVAAGFLVAVGGIIINLRNQEMPDTFSHIPGAEVVEAQAAIEPAPQPAPTPELEGIRLAADPETAGPILASTNEQKEEDEAEEPAVTEEEAESAHGTYPVRQGDTLGDIALHHNVRVRDLMETNEGIDHPNRIYHGQTLALPEPWEFPVVGLFSGIVDEPRPYTVQPGETLSAIAAQRGFTLEAVLEANPDISDPNLVAAGELVFIPPHPANSMPDFNQDEVHGTYVVQEGDTLSEIAIKYGTSIDQILEVNQQIDDPNLIFSGQVVAVPEPGDVIPVTGGVQVAGYVVQPGDTLSEIALQHGLTVDEIVVANDIENPNLIIAGQVLVIPERPQAAGGAEIETKEGRHYIVREGDTLGEIALRHRMTFAKLVEANDLENPNRIVPGQVIIIPEA